MLPPTGITTDRTGSKTTNQNPKKNLRQGMEVDVDIYRMNEENNYDERNFEI
jgi:hypothetical protein